MNTVKSECCSCTKVRERLGEEITATGRLSGLGLLEWERHFILRVASEIHELVLSEAILDFGGTLGAGGSSEKITP